MKNSILSSLLFFSITATLLAQNTCGSFTLKLYSHFDGWSGNSLAVKINNNIVYPDVTFNSGHGPYIFSFPVAQDDVISVLFKRNGSWADDCRYEVYDENNVLLAVRDGVGTGSAGGPENTYGLLACPSGRYCGVYVVELIDGYGNSGWGGSTLDVFINNVLTTSGTHLDLSHAWADREDISFAVGGNDTVDLIYNTAPNMPTSFMYYYDAYSVFDETDSLIVTQTSALINNDPNNATGIPNTLRIITCQGYTPPAPARPVYDKNPFKAEQSNEVADVDLNNTEDLFVYPSPAYDHLVIKSVKAIQSYMIYNRFGVPMKTGQLNETIIELNDLPSDIYYLELLSKNNEIIRKLIQVVK